MNQAQYFTGFLICGQRLPYAIMREWIQALILPAGVKEALLSQVEQTGDLPYSSWVSLLNNVGLSEHSVSYYLAQFGTCNTMPLAELIGDTPYEPPTDTGIFSYEFDKFFE